MIKELPEAKIGVIKLNIAKPRRNPWWFEVFALLLSDMVCSNIFFTVCVVLSNFYVPAFMYEGDKKWNVEYT